MARRNFLFLSLTALLAVSVARVAAWDWLWAHQFTSTVSINAYGGAADGTGVYASGFVFGGLPGATSLGLADGYIRKIDHSGNVLWTRRVGTTRYDDSAGIVTDEDGLYITGVTCGAFAGYAAAGGCDAYAARLTPEGVLVWVTQFGTAGLDTTNQYDAIAVHPSGVYVAGKTEGTFPGETPAGGPSTFLARFDRSTGALLWVRQFGPPDPDFANVGGVGVDDTGVAVAGNTTTAPGMFRAEARKYSLDGSLQWSRAYDQSAPPCGPFIFDLESHRGNVYMIGQIHEGALTTCVTQPKGQSSIVGLLQKLGAGGQTVWQRRVKAGMPGREGGAPIAPFAGAKAVHATDAGVFIGANLRKLRFAGDVRRLPHSDQSQCSDPGRNDNAAFQGFDAYVRRYDLDGNVLWTHQFGSNLYEIVTGLGSDDTRVYAVGMTRCVVEEGIDPETGASVDAFLVGFALDPDSQPGRIQLIIGQLETLSDAERIAPGDFTALVAHLEGALAALDRSKPDVARSSLHAFIALVQNYQSTGRLTNADADALISAALGWEL